MPVLFKDFDDDLFKDIREHFAQHFGNHKMAHESTGGHFDFADINIEKFFKKPNGFDESDLFGNDAVSYSCRSSIEIKMEVKNGQKCKTVRISMSIFHWVLVWENQSKA